MSRIEFVNEECIGIDTMLPEERLAILQTVAQCLLELDERRDVILRLLSPHLNGEQSLVEEFIDLHLQTEL